jgi:thermitase
MRLGGRCSRWGTSAVAVLGAALLLGGSFTGVSAQGAPVDVGRGRPDVVPDELLVKFRPGTAASDVADAHRRAGGQVVRDIPGLDVKVVHAASPGALAAYQQNPNVEYVEPNGIAYPTWTPNDPYYASDQQWGLNNSASTVSSDPDIDAPQAWNVTRGSPGETIAIVDTGVTVNHPDLASKMVDSRNWYDGSGTQDTYGHGTHVAGIAAASTNNGIGVAGVCPNCGILNAKVCDDFGSCPYDRIANGVLWSVGCEVRDARNNCLVPVRARSINLSIAGTFNSTTLQEAINKAWNRGAVISCAAGNNGTNTPYYPAAYSNCIAVAATDASDAKASWSNYGSGWVDVAAPGVNILSTLNPNGATFSNPSGYGFLSGTSMASPFVAGVAGLVWSTGARTNTAVRQKIESTSDSITGTGSAWSKGRINACRAVGATGC